MRFAYKAETKEGKTVSGSAEAENRQAMLQLLHKEGLKPILVTIDHEAKKSAKGELFGGKK